MKEKNIELFGLKIMLLRLLIKQNFLISFVIKDLKNVSDAIHAIKVMEVRGAPLIGATAAFGLVLSILEIMISLF